VRSRAVRTAALLGAVGVLTLSGCALRPGTALAVGDDTVSNQRIEDLTTLVCDVQRDQLAAQGQTIPLAQLKASVASTVLNREVTEQAADEFGVEPDETYQQTVDSTRARVPLSDKDELRDFVDLVTVQDYTESIITAIGEEVSEPEASPEEAQQAGVDAFTDFVSDADIEVDPRYGFTYDGAEVATTGGGSVAVSDLAVAAGNVTDPAAGAEYAASLPPDQVCGA
jgi:hypothetical protein